jgi:hypothetical protein
LPTAGTELTAILGLSTTTPAINNGQALFAVVGTLTIPNDLAITSYGGYATTSAIEVRFDDAPVAAPEDFI